MAYKRYLLIDQFLYEHKKEIIDGWFTFYYTKTQEYRLHSNFDEFSENLKVEVTYLFKKSLAHTFKSKEMNQEHHHFGENRAAISTSLEDLSTMTFSMEAYIGQFLSNELEKGTLVISYQDLFNYSVRIRVYFTAAFQSILAGYMSYLVGHMNEIMG
ncbi:hypothetical protein ACWOFR_17530 [Carnobacterium gallinarum]|uniref:hypothetical protein n=1 Tax=Carnobacterium gallinarum TaxID=2749 RepID=UPI0005565FB2|nr:hypothetical protein [Carnobacterium gallinarum]